MSINHMIQTKEDMTLTAGSFSSFYPYYCVLAWQRCWQTFAFGV